MEKQNIVVMGGSFNPPTIAHLKIIDAAMKAVHAEKGYLVPVSHAYLKRKMVKAGEGHLCISGEMRLDMLNDMFGSNPKISIYTEEMKEPFAITYQTMSRIQEIHPNANIFFVAGTDKIRLIEEFTRKNDFLDRFGILAFARNGEDPYTEICKYENLLPHKDFFVIVKQPDGIDQVSSTAVRKHLFDIDMVSNMLHPAVVPVLRKLDATDFPREIIRFTGEYAFLDSSYLADVDFEGLVYPSVESAFQASKLADDNDRKRFTQYGQDKAKQKGASIVPCHGWEERKLDIMESLQREKFLRHPDLLTKLLATGNEKLIAGNNKKDKFWGVNLITWEGENHLGRILTKLRTEFQKAGDRR